MFEDKLSKPLYDHIKDVNLTSLCRVTPQRISERALPHIGFIELVKGEDFGPVYDELYKSMFPKRAERERSDLIIERLEKEFAGERVGLAPYRVIGIRDYHGQAIGAAQFSVLMLPGGQYAVPYLQYIYVRYQNRRQDMAEVLHTLVLAVSTSDGAKERRTVPFTLFETEPPNHGEDEASRTTATERIQIHSKAGAAALVLRKTENGELVSAHVQPGLEADDPPLTLTWAIRPSPALGPDESVASIGKDLVAAYYQSLRDEGFPEANIKIAETIVEKRSDGCIFCLVSLSQLNNLEGVASHVSS